MKYKEAQRKSHYAIEPAIPKYDEIWNGKLRMTIAGKATFEDCRSYMLEDRIGEILIALYEAFYSQRLNTIQEYEQLKKEIEELDRIQEDDKKRQQMCDLYNAEIEKTKALINKAAYYETACQIRNYIDAVRKSPNCPDNNPEWLEWANKKADWFDPAISREDDFFGERKHELDTMQKELKRHG